MMDMKEGRKRAGKRRGEAQGQTTGKYRGKRFFDYVEEQIREAQVRGEFDNLPGSGKPLDLDSNQFAGDKALAYSMLKQNGFAPPEIELAKEIRSESEKPEPKLPKLRRRGNSLRTRRIPPSAGEKRAFNVAVEKA